VKWFLFIPAFGLVWMISSCFSATGDMLDNGKAYCNHRGMYWVSQPNNIPAYCVGGDGRTMVVPERQMWCRPERFDPATARCDNSRPNGGNDE